MKMYNIGIGGFFIRFHLLVALIVVMGFAGYMYLGIILGMILFLITITGFEFKKAPDIAAASDETYHPEWFKNMHIPLRRYNIWHKRHHWAAH